jgi:hypothetical protein
MIVVAPGIQAKAQPHIKLVLEVEVMNHKLKFLNYELLSYIANS